MQTVGQAVLFNISMTIDLGERKILNSNQIWWGMVSFRLFLPKRRYKSRTPMTQPGLSHTCVMVLWFWQNSRHWENKLISILFASLINEARTGNKNVFEQLMFYTYKHKQNNIEHLNEQPTTVNKTWMKWSTISWTVNKWDQGNSCKMTGK